jgi:hypothetical protein
VHPHGRECTRTNKATLVDEGQLGLLIFRDACEHCGHGRRIGHRSPSGSGQYFDYAMELSVGLAKSVSRCPQSRVALAENVPVVAMPM